MTRPAPYRHPLRSLAAVRTPLQVLIVAVILALLLKTFVVDAIVVPSHSMESTILPGDYVLVNKLVYGGGAGAPFRADLFRLPGFGSIRRGDVVVFALPAPPGGRGTTFIKRCVALPGDRVAFRNGAAFVNGIALPGWMSSTPDAFCVVPKAGDVIPLAGNLSEPLRALIEGEGHTLGSGEGGEVTVDGKAGAYYTVRKNYLYVLGDNADRSYDSRQWGFLPEENVIGEAMMVYLSLKPEGGARLDRIGTIVR